MPQRVNRQGNVKGPKEDSGPDLTCFFLKNYIAAGFEPPARF